MNGKQTDDQVFYTNPELVSGNPAIDNIKKLGQDKLFILASAIYIALPILQFFLNTSGTIPIQFIGVVGMILLVFSCNTKAYPGVKTAGFSVLKGYAITMIVICGLLALASVTMIASYDELMKNEETSEYLNMLYEELTAITGIEMSIKSVFGILLAIAAVLALRYAFVIVMCVRLRNTLRTGRNRGKIPVILAVFFVIMAFINVIGLFGSAGDANIFSLFLVLLDTAADISFTLVIFKYNNSLNMLWYS